MIEIGFSWRGNIFSPYTNVDISTHYSFPYLRQPVYDSNRVGLKKKLIQFEYIYKI